MSTKPIIVIGLGYGGQETACRFAEQGNLVIAFDKNEYFVDAVNMIEALCVPTESAKSCVYDLNKFDKRVQVSQAECCSYENGAVTLKLNNGETLVLKTNKSGSYTGGITDLSDELNEAVAKGVHKIVFSTGMQGGYALAPYEGITSYKEATKAFKELRCKITNSKKMIIVGGGAVATEFAGFFYDINPNGCLLAIRGDKVLQGYPESFTNTATGMFIDMLGNNFLTYCIPVDTYDDSRYREFRNFVFFDSIADIKMSDGTVVEGVDAILFGYQPKPLGPHFLGSTPTTCDRTMTSKDQNVHAIGDLVIFSEPHKGDAKMAYHAQMQAASLVKGKTFSAHQQSMISPFGSQYGCSVLPVSFLGECCVGNFVTQKLAHLKSYAVKKKLSGRFSEE